MQWRDVLADKSLNDLPYKIELNEKGNIEMSPASVMHSFLQGQLVLLLGQELTGYVFTELAIQTTKGVRVPDVAWGNHSFVKKHKDELFASSAPQICVEIISPSNSKGEMSEKVQLFLEAGAREVWIVTETGEISFFDQNGEQSQSQFDESIKSIPLF